MVNKLISDKWWDDDCQAQGLIQWIQEQYVTVCAAFIEFLIYFLSWPHGCLLSEVQNVNVSQDIGEFAVWWGHKRNVHCGITVSV